MSSTYILKNGCTGLYFVSGKGYVGNKQEASRLSTIEAGVIRNNGVSFGLAFGSVIVENGHTSWAVVYIREGEGRKLLDGLSKPSPDASKNQLDPSRRRFADRDEALHHGARFPERRKEAGDKPGTAKHEGYFVVQTSDPVNSKVNWKTGLTNSI